MHHYISVEIGSVGLSLGRQESSYSLQQGETEKGLDNLKQAIAQNNASTELLRLVTEIERLCKHGSGLLAERKLEEAARMADSVDAV
jgi:hypothetical protein